LISLPLPFLTEVEMFPQSTSVQNLTILFISQVRAIGWVHLQAWTSLHGVDVLHLFLRYAWFIKECPGMQLITGLREDHPPGNTCKEHFLYYSKQIVCLYLTTGSLGSRECFFVVRIKSTHYIWKQNSTVNCWSLYSHKLQVSYYSEPSWFLDMGALSFLIPSLVGTNFGRHGYTGAGSQPSMPFPGTYSSHTYISGLVPFPLQKQNSLSRAGTAGFLAAWTLVGSSKGGVIWWVALLGVIGKGGGGKENLTL
jgi:hypothetical protein